MTWMVTGGAGYIGAHVVRALLTSGREVVVFDDLSSGFDDFVPEATPLVVASLLDGAALERTLREHAVTGVIHLGALKYAGVSVQQPLEFYDVNVTGTIRLLQAMGAAGVGSIVFSSSAAIFGTPDVDIVTEATTTAPESPYGESKLVGEWLLRDVARIRDLRHTSLRYFNVVGSGDPAVFDASPHNLFPLVLKALAEGRAPTVFGTDYPTPDGSCVRDYIHVADVADAHVLAAAKLEAGAELAPAYNLGLGKGISVLEILDAMRRVLGHDFAHETAPRRPGDPAQIVTSAELARRDLDWTARYDLDEMVRSASEAWNASATART
jgi:UDP-glucose 4-epimerase